MGEYTVYEAIRTIQEAAGNWCEYLEENDREDECDKIDRAVETVDAFLKGMTS
jgi:hypothetical protein